MASGLESGHTLPPEAHHRVPQADLHAVHRIDVEAQKLQREDGTLQGRRARQRGSDNWSRACCTGHSHQCLMQPRREQSSSGKTHKTLALFPT